MTCTRLHLQSQMDVPADLKTKYNENVVFMSLLISYLYVFFLSIKI